MLPWRPTNPTSEEATSIPAFVTQFNPMDVFMGRGTPSVRHEGNRFFRQLINEGKERYATCDTNTEKDALARGVVAAVASRNGRFLQKITTRAQGTALGVPHFIRDAWVYASEEAVLIKVKQCFRDLFKKSEQAEAGNVNPPVRSYSSTRRPSRNYYSRGDNLGFEGAAAAASAVSNVSAAATAAAAVPGLASSSSSHNPQRATVLNQLLRNQQLYTPSSSIAAPMPTSNEASQLMALLQHQQQRNKIIFEHKLMAKANADTILRQQQQQQQQIGNQQTTADGIINSVLGQPSPQDAARRMSWQAAVQAAAASSGTFPSPLNSARIGGSGCGSMEDTSTRSTRPPPLTSNERAQLAREVQNQKKPLSGNETSAMNSFLHLQQRGPPEQQSSNPSQPEGTVGLHDTGTAVPTAAALGLSTLSSVLGMPSDSLPSSIDEAQQKIQAARWVVAQLLMVSRSGEQTTNSSHHNNLTSRTTPQPPPLSNSAADEPFADDEDDGPTTQRRAEGAVAPAEQNLAQFSAAEDQRKPPPRHQFGRSNNISSGSDIAVADGEADKPSVGGRKRSRDESEGLDHGGDDDDDDDRNEKLQPIS